MTQIEPVTLRGRLVTLEPLTPGHHDELVEAVRDGEVWNLWYTVVPAPERMRAEIERRLAEQAAGSMLPFVSRRNSDGLVLGMTTYMAIDATLPRVEIGSTWNRASASGTGTNADAKLLLLTHAFEVLGCPAVEFRTHWMNAQSRAAIERLGRSWTGCCARTRAWPTGRCVTPACIRSSLPNGPRSVRGSNTGFPAISGPRRTKPPVLRAFTTSRRSAAPVAGRSTDRQFGGRSVDSNATTESSTGTGTAAAMRMYEGLDRSLMPKLEPKEPSAEHRPGHRPSGARTCRKPQR